MFLRIIIICGTLGATAQAGDVELPGAVYKYQDDDTISVTYQGETRSFVPAERCQNRRGGGWRRGRDRTPPPVDLRNVCETFAIRHYREAGYNNSGALNLAAQFCSANQEIFREEALVERVFTLYREGGYNASGALNLTGQYLTNNRSAVLGRRQSFDWFFTKYKEGGYNNSGALSLTAQIMTSVPETSMRCVSDKYELYRQDGYNSSGAINLAVQFCNNR